jgi:hypothetical protein
MVQRDDMNLASPLECLGDLHQLIPGKTRICLTGHHSRSIRRILVVVVEFWTAYAALGVQISGGSGHGDVVRPVGGWQLRWLPVRQPYIRLGIVLFLFFLV